MNKEAVFHQILSEYAYPLSKNRVMIKVRTQKNDLHQAEIVFIDKYKYIFNFMDHLTDSFKSVAMEKIASDSLFDFYGIELDYDMISMAYYFKLHSPAETLCYGNYHFFDEKDTGIAHCFNIPIISKEDIFQTPDWAKESIVYHIFPDRFYRGDHFKGHDKFQPWDSKVHNQSLLGGNLQGVIDKLDYLSDLGVNTLYFNPIFLAPGNHKYNTSDFYLVDPDFGTNDQFRELVDKLHGRNMKIILDAVVHCTGTGFFAFQDLLKNNEGSKYRGWYDVKRFPVEVKDPPNYLAWSYYSALPKVVLENPETSRYFLDMMEWWVKEMDVDGWRLDTADEISHQFLREARKRIKAVKKEAILIGEVWYDARAWLKGDQLDTVMNYTFCGNVGDFIGRRRIDPQTFSERMAFIQALYHTETQKVLWNLIGSHDTPRFLTEAGRDKERLKLASLVQMTYPGTPVIYYGDEVGMEGSGDPDCRRGMLWNEKDQDGDLLEHYKKLIRIRKENKALVYGRFKETLLDNQNQLYSFQRILSGETVEVVINNSDEVRHTAIGQDSQDLYRETPLKKQERHPLPPRSFLILKHTRD